VELAAEGADEGPAINVRLVVRADQHCIVVGRVEGKGADEPGMPDVSQIVRVPAAT
jgi:hypothetical protein